MNFEDRVVNRKERYALGTETESGRFYVAIPVANRLVNYDEYYEITSDEMNRFGKDSAAALAFVERCRRREEDRRLMEPAQPDRGVST